MMYENITIENLNPQVTRLITADEANLWSMRVIENPQMWERRAGFFYTIGATAYLDTPEVYKRSVHALSFEILKVFADLEDKILQHFDAMLHPALAVPGFHIFNHLANGKVGDIHLDAPFQQQDIPFEFTEPFTFTLCLALPKVGGGLNYWDDLTDDEQVILLGGATLPEKQSYLEYEPGMLYTHSGFCPHQIAQRGDMSPTEYRITLQGHGMTHVATGKKIVYF